MTLWYFNIDEFPDEKIQEVLLNLPDYIALEIDRYKFNDDKKCRLISRLLIQKFVLETTSVWDWENWKRTEMNKPYIKNGPFFNISHSGKIVVVVFSIKSPIGIDVQEMNDIDIRELASFFHESELLFLEKNKFEIDQFYKIWTRKEAFLKAIGIGFLEGLDNFNVLTDSINHNMSWYWDEFQLVENYKFCICSANQINKISRTQIDYNTLNKFINEKIFI